MILLLVRQDEKHRAHQARQAKSPRESFAVLARVHAVLLRLYAREAVFHRVAPIPPLSPLVHVHRPPLVCRRGCFQKTEAKAVALPRYHATGVMPTEDPARSITQYSTTVHCTTTVKLKIMPWIPNQLGTSLPTYS